MTLVPAELCIEQAIEYGRKGWRVQPLPPGKQHPGRDDWQILATSDPGAIRGLFNARPLWQGISIATGEKSGIFVVDVDVADEKVGDDTLADLEHQYGKLPDTYEVLTARGGRHLYFKYPSAISQPGLAIANDAGLRLGPGLDVRGEGGQVVAPPAYSSKPGWEDDPYEIDLGGQDEPAEAPLWLLQLLTAPLTTEPRRQRPQGARSGAPGDLFEAAHSWAELLEADGATCVGTRLDRRSGSEYELWARPGVGDHHGATLYYGGADVLKVFTSSWTGLDEGATYSRFGYYTATRHGGDHSAAARMLREEGYVESDAPWMSGTVGTSGVSSQDEITGEWAYTEDPATWPEPQSFPSRAVDPWPMDVLPVWIRAHCEAVARKLQVPVDLCAQTALGTLSAITMGKVKVQVDHGWQEYTNLYLVTAMLSGTGKSPAVKAMAAPVWALERMLREQVQDDILRKEREKAILTQKAKQMEKSAAMGSVPMEEYLRALGEAEAIEVPVRPKLLSDDATPEVLAKAMSEHGGRMSIVSPEGELFDMVQGAYAKKVNINIYLKGWSAEPVRIDRKGTIQGSGTAIEIEEALLAVSVAVQPHMLEDIARDDNLRGRGFTTRFMPSVPEDTLGMRDHMAAREATAPGPEYLAKMLAIGTRVHQWQMPLIIQMSKPAQELFDDWRTQLELRMHRSGELRQVAEWVSKITGSAIRVAGLLALAAGADRESIDAETMGRAIRLGDYWIRQAVGLTTGLWEGAAIDVPRCERVLRWVRNGGQERAVVPATALRRAMKWTAEETDEVISDLIRYSYLILAPSESTGRVGRPKSPDLVFSPHVWIYATSALSARSGESSLSLSLSHTPPLEVSAEIAEIPEPKPGDSDGDPYSLF